jgi:integrase
MVLGDMRVRGSLGTRNQDSAHRLIHKLEIALSEGAASTFWTELLTLLPRNTFMRFADLAGFKEPHYPTWIELKTMFKVSMQQRMEINKLAKSTIDRYGHTIREFELYLSEQKVSLLRDIRMPLVESFKVWRIDRIKQRKYCRGGTGLLLDIAVLHCLFSFAVKREMVAKNPVQLEGRPGNNSERGAEPFSAEELLRLREHAGADTLLLLTLRWTGFRGSDAVRITWRELDLAAREANRLTQKRKKRVVIPLHAELLFALEGERERRKPTSDDRILLNPTTGRPLTRPGLYRRTIALGRRSGVPNAHPHRFRDTFAVDLLLRGASPYDVAKMLGDTIETVERYYMPFVKELRERVRTILETGIGLEELAKNTPESLQIASKKLN